MAAREWAVVFDAGSTGTRLRVFSWLAAFDGDSEVDGAALEAPAFVEQFTQAPALRVEGASKVRPGISSFDGDPAGAARSILPLVLLAAQLVPVTVQPTALVLLRATAGMRLLPEERAQPIYERLWRTVLANSKLRPHRESFSTLSGVDEGVFGWMSVNYLMANSLNRSAATPFTIGALDLGGASAEITMPASLGTLNTVGVWAGSVHELVTVFSYSHLGYGAHQASASRHVHSHVG